VEYFEASGGATLQVSWQQISACLAPPDSPALQSPSNGSILAEGDDLTLIWSSATGAAEYYVECWGGPTGVVSRVLPGNSWSLASPSAGYTYSWHAKARNAAGESAWSDTWAFTLKPAAPTNLSAQAVSCSQTNLSWSDNSEDEEGYHIYRNGSYVGQTDVNVTSYQDSGLNAATSYVYVVQAFRGDIESAASNASYVTTPPCGGAAYRAYLPAVFSNYMPPIIPVFVYPVAGQTLSYDSSWFFKVHPIAGADGYLWGFAQNGVFVWENMRDEGSLSGNEYVILAGSVAHSKFVPGSVEVWVRAWINGHWTEAAVITIYLQ
jgi:hypothetical protein